MAMTSLIVTDKDTKEKKYIQIMTQENPDDDGLLVVVQETDETFQYKAGADQGVDPRNSEEEYHRELRTMAAEKNQLITSHSTDPEWNPEGYVQNLEDYGS